MARVPKITYDTSGYARADQARMRGAETVASLYARAGENLGQGLARGAAGYVGARDRKQARRLQQDALNQRAAEHADHERRMQAHLALDAIRADVLIQKDMMARAQERAEALKVQAIQNPGQFETIRPQLDAVEGELQTHREGLQTAQARIQAVQAQFMQPQARPVTKPEEGG